MSGVSGSGKSTTAKAIASEQDAICLRSDAIRKQLAGIDLMQRGGDDIYTSEMTIKTYARLTELGVLLASKGCTVILDAKYDRVSLRSQAIAAAQARIFHMKSFTAMRQWKFCNNAYAIALKQTTTLLTLQLTSYPVSKPLLKTSLLKS